MPRGVKFSVSLDTQPMRDLARRLRAYGGDLRPLYEIWGGILEATVRHRFDTGRGPGGVPWTPTKRQRRGAVGVAGPVKNKILVDRGNLERSVRYEVRPNSVLVGFDGASESVKHAAAHQWGSHRRTVVVRHFRVITQMFGVPIAPKRITVRGHARMTNLPARPMLGIDENDKRDLKEAAVEHARKVLK
jgi:phage gpG-like protein